MAEENWEVVWSEEVHFVKDVSAEWKECRTERSSAKNSLARRTWVEQVWPMETLVEQNRSVETWVRQTRSEELSMEQTRSQERLAAKSLAKGSSVEETSGGKR